MKLDFVEIAGFRGFRDKARFDFPGGFVVFCGRNGAGKSTVLDAVDFALTGSINKFSVKSARGGGLEDHVWWVGAGRAEEHYVSVGFSDSGNNAFTVTRSRDRGMRSNINNPFKRLCHETLPASTSTIETLLQTTLIRDESIVALSVDLPEQQRFSAVRAAIGGLAGPDHSKRTGELLGAAKWAEEQQQYRVDDIQLQLGRFLSELTEARSAVERLPDVADALKAVASAGLELPANPRERSVWLRGYVASKNQALQRIESARAQSEVMAPELSYIRSEEAARSLEIAQTSQQNAIKEKERTEQLLAAAERADAAEKEGNVLATHLVAILEHGEHLGLQDGHCPLCAAKRTPSEFAGAIDAARKRLAERGARLSASRQAVLDASQAVATATSIFTNASRRLEEERARRSTAERALSTISRVYTDNQFSGSPENPKDAQRLLLDERQNLTRVERALYVLEASSAADRVATLRARVADQRERFDAETAKLESTHKSVQAAKQIDESSRTTANQILQEQFDTVMPLLKELYRRLRPHAAWTEIDSDFGGKVRASLNFTVGNGHNLQFLFSSGQRRATGLAFLLAIHLSRRWCNWNSLLLDDPVQHIDDYRALNLVETLAAIRRSGRQIIIAVEDAALADLLCRRLRSTIGELGRRFDLQTSKGGTAEIASTQDIVPMPHAVLRPAQAS
ncbi:MAG TPA: AAA family ATPase [Xanthobacteraceae bacterium]|jgi:DNA repair exonuclease SbcCD ATPase subunit|nr:AAA family ATPase [Xanthobacteraceae bacterium]